MARVHLRNLTAILDTKKRDSLSGLAAPLARLPTIVFDFYRDSKIVGERYSLTLKLRTTICQGMNPRIVQRSTTPCRTCGEAIEKRRKLDGTFKKRQPKYCSYRCWYAEEGPRLSAKRHAQTGAEIRKADEVWKSINSGFCPKRMEEPDNSTGIRCPKCGRVSYNINDLIYRYCGRCKQFHDLMPFNWTSGRYPNR